MKPNVVKIRYKYRPAYLIAKTLSKVYAMNHIKANVVIIFVENLIKNNLYVTKCSLKQITFISI
jgi:hypothetical protein